MAQQILFPDAPKISRKVVAQMKQQAVKMQNGTWTVINTETNEHRTFRVRTQSKDSKFAPGQRIVSVMSGPDNERSYTGFGFANDDRIVVWPSKRGDGKRSCYEWYADMLNVLLGEQQSVAKMDYSHYEIKGSGTCYRCNRKLTHPTSISTGIGPICSGRK